MPAFFFLPDFVFSFGIPSFPIKRDCSTLFPPPSPKITAEPGALEEGLPPKQSSNYIFGVRRAQPKINEEDPQRLCSVSGPVEGLLKPKPQIWWGGGVALMKTLMMTLPIVVFLLKVHKLHFNQSRSSQRKKKKRRRRLSCSERIIIHDGHWHDLLSAEWKFLSIHQSCIFLLLFIDFFLPSGIRHWW